MIKNVKICAVCGKQFPCSPSSKKITCGKGCSHILLSERRKGRKYPEEAKKRMSETAKSLCGEERLKLLRKGTPAAQKSPLAGRFETNSSAKYWCMKSPDGVVYQFTNLSWFIRENAELFGSKTLTDEDVVRISSGIRHAKISKSHISNGWELLDWSEENNVQRKRKK